MKMLISGSRARMTASMCLGQSQNSLRTRPVPTWYSACGVITPVSVASTKTAHDGPAASESPPTQRRSGAAAVGVGKGVVPPPALDRAVVVVGVDDDEGSLVGVVPLGVVATTSSGACSRAPLLVIDSVGALESMTATSAASRARSRTAMTSASHGRGAREAGRRCTAHTLPSTASASAAELLGLDRGEVADLLPQDRIGHVALAEEHGTGRGDVAAVVAESGRVEAHGVEVARLGDRLAVDRDREEGVGAHEPLAVRVDRGGRAHRSPELRLDLGGGEQGAGLLAVGIAERAVVLPDRGGRGGRGQHVARAAPLDPLCGAPPPQAAPASATSAAAMPTSAAERSALRRVLVSTGGRR